MKENTSITCIEEQPSNIGSYEVPTQRDLVLFTKDLLMNLFETYKREAMAILRDIKEVKNNSIISLFLNYISCAKCSHSRYLLTEFFFFFF